MGDYSSICPRFHQAIELIGRRWSGAILHVLLRGPQRFNELLSSIPGLSDRLLTERLRELESHGLLTREVLPGPPIAVRYSLTEAGIELAPTLDALAQWAERRLSIRPAMKPTLVSDLPELEAPSQRMEVQVLH